MSGPNFVHGLADMTVSGGGKHSATPRSRALEHLVTTHAIPCGPTARWSRVCAAQGPRPARDPSTRPPTTTTVSAVQNTERPVPQYPVEGIDRVLRLLTMFKQE